MWPIVCLDLRWNWCWCK